MRILKLIALILSLSGCAGESLVFKDSIQLIFQKQSTDVTLEKTLNPNYRYLRMLQDGRPILLALGYVEQDAATGDTTDIWYSGPSEVLKIKSGRITAMTGTPLADVTVRNLGEPSWSGALKDAASALGHFSRERDVALNYRFGIKEKVSLQRITKPVNHSLAGMDKPNLVWFQESYEPNNLPPSIFAVDASDGVPEQGRVAYSWQCLTPTVCLSMQAWTLKDQALVIGQKKP